MTGAPYSDREDEGRLVGRIRTSVTTAMWPTDAPTAAEMLDKIQTVIDDYRRIAAEGETQ